MPTQTETPTRSSADWLWRVGVVASGVVGLWMRLVVLHSPVGALNSDEATTGLMAIDILHGRFPVVLGGQMYTSALETYPLAVITKLFGTHPFVIKLLFVAIWSGASVLVYPAARVAASVAAARLAGLLCWLAPGAMLVLSTRAYLGYAAGLLAVGLSLWATGAALARPAADRRSAALAGAAAGLAFYIHPMFLCVLGPHIAVACWYFRRQARQWWVPAAVAAVAVNLPWLVWNAANGFHSNYGDSPAKLGYLQRLKGFGTGLMPRALGLIDTNGAWVLPHWPSLAIYAAVVAVAAVGWVRLARLGGRPGLAMAVAAVAVWPLMAVLSNLEYVADGRYAVIPFAPLVVCVGAGVDGLLIDRLRQRSGRWVPAALLAVAALWVAALVLPFLSRPAFDRVEDPNGPIVALVHRLDQRGITKVIGSYWLVQPVSLWSGGRIAGHATWPLPVRSERLAEIVDRAPADEVAHLFEIGQENLGSLPLPIEAYDREEIAGIALFIPKATGG